MTQLDSAIEMLRKEFGGSIVAPADAGYDEHRAVWNAMIDKRPALIARCQTPADVAAAVQFGREHDIPVAVRGGGHSAAGKGTCDDGIVVDLSQMNSVEVDTGRKTARAGWGHDVGRLRRRDPGGRPRDTGRCHLDHGHRGPHARRRLRVVVAPIRALLRQPAVGRPRHRRRAHPHVLRGLELRAVLGPARWRRQLRRRDELRVPPPRRSGRSCSAGSSAGRSTRPPTCWRSTGSRRATSPTRSGCRPRSSPRRRCRSCPRSCSSRAASS